MEQKLKILVVMVMMMAAGYLLGRMHGRQHEFEALEKERVNNDLRVKNISAECQKLISTNTN